MIAMENYGLNLKEFLLNSRALNNYPSYATKEQRFSTLHEAQAIDIALGIAKGMAYLQSLSVSLFLAQSHTLYVHDCILFINVRFPIKDWHQEQCIFVAVTVLYPKFLVSEWTFINPLAR